MSDLKELRQQKKWSRPKLAEKLGCSLSHVSLLELGLKPLSPALAAKTAKAFRVNADKLLHASQINYLSTKLRRALDKLSGLDVKDLAGIGEEGRSHLLQLAKPA